VGDFAHRAHVGHAHRLAAAGVVGHGQHDAGDVLWPDFKDVAFQRRQVHVALEGMDQPRLPSLGDHQVARLRTRVLDMGARRVEMGVVEHDFPRPGNGGEENVLRRAALVGRNHMLEAGDVAHGSLEAVKGRRAGIGLVAGDHPRPLARRHGAGAAVGEQVDQHVAGVEQKRVVAGGLQRRFPLRQRGEANRLHRADAKRFDDGLWMEFLHGVLLDVVVWRIDVAGHAPLSRHHCVSCLSPGASIITGGPWAYFKSEARTQHSGNGTADAAATGLCLSNSRNAGNTRLAPSCLQPEAGSWDLRWVTACVRCVMLAPT
jgi:hypothetical protein